MIDTKITLLTFFLILTVVAEGEGTRLLANVS